MPQALRPAVKLHAEGQHQMGRLGFSIGCGGSPVRFLPRRWFAEALLSGQNPGLRFTTVIAVPIETPVICVVCIGDIISSTPSVTAINHTVRRGRLQQKSGKKRLGVIDDMGIAGVGGRARAAVKN